MGPLTFFSRNEDVEDFVQSFVVNFCRQVASILSSDLATVFYTEVCRLQTSVVHMSNETAYYLNFHWLKTQISKAQNRLLKFVYCARYQRSTKKASFLSFLLRPFTVLMKKTRALKQPIIFRCLWLKRSPSKRYFRFLWT